jgi:alkanesulfonate monooxygenase SsuD/methylene tetrahydromethanopterin reductase-like flavin-dependent oxidoreductase (luciferase family)
VRFGLDVAQQRVPFDEVVSRTLFAEDLGFEGAWGFDHFQPLYGEGPGECFEGMMTLAALASATKRIRLGLMITGVTYRHPSLFASQALTLDHASHGRFDMSLGAAWFEPEHRALGMPFPATGDRFDLLEDALEIVTRLMTGERVSYEGRHVSLDGAQMQPLPVQRPHPPIWIGGTGPRRLIPAAARWADVWHGFGTPNSLRDTAVLLERLAEEAGRRPASIVKASSISLSEPMKVVRRHVEKWREAGFGYLVCNWPEEGRARVEEFATKVLPKLRWPLTSP